MLCRDDGESLEQVRFPPFWVGPCARKHDAPGRDVIRAGPETAYGDKPVKAAIEAGMSARQAWDTRGIL